MLRRLTLFAERNPRGAATAMLAIAIALCVTILGVLVAIIEMENPFSPPYANEVTPLSWDESLVTWTSVDTVIFDGGGGYWTHTGDPAEMYEMQDGFGRNYSSMRFCWEYSDGGVGGSCANDSRQLELSTGTETTVECSIVREWEEDVGEIRYSLVVTDLQGNGAFDKGDSITLKKSPSAGLYGNDVYTVALVCLYPVLVKIGEFSFAFDDGEFYSWESTQLDWHQPWWE
ncbi:MAG: hypothetical protein JSV90_01640 [Methanobacteriota archaeon]|nr:MAG: hypothetical protein JSV90_01640 [Euryarchaeota archaeon]